jgi:sugar O-acyltransferase (sialic acid O-acetyltransferase NeuD family)
LHFSCFETLFLLLIFHIMVTGEKIALIGAGGAARDILCQLADAWKQEGKDYRGHVVFTEPDQIHQPRMLMNCPVIAQSAFDPSVYQAVLAMGNPADRASVLTELPPETRFGTIIHPSCIISEWVEIGPGAAISAGCILTCNIRIGAHCHLNYNTTIAHDFVAGDFFTTAPSASVNGNCSAGNRVYIGSQAALRQGVSLADDVIIGMGSIVLNSISKPGTYAGVPAVKIG